MPQYKIVDTTDEPYITTIAADWRDAYDIANALHIRSALIYRIENDTVTLVYKRGYKHVS
jgi:hypothetical protein